MKVLSICHDPDWADQGVLFTSKFPRAKIRWKDTKRSVKDFIHDRSKWNWGGVVVGGRVAHNGNWHKTTSVNRVTIYINSGNKEIPPVESRGSEQTPLLSRLLLREGSRGSRRSLLQHWMHGGLFRLSCTPILSTVEIIYKMNIPIHDFSWK